MLVNFYPPRTCSQSQVRNANQQALPPAPEHVGPELLASFPVWAFAELVRLGGFKGGGTSLHWPLFMEAPWPRQGSGAGRWALCRVVRWGFFGRRRWAEGCDGVNPGLSGKDPSDGGPVGAEASGRSRLARSRSREGIEEGGGSKKTPAFRS